MENKSIIYIATILIIISIVSVTIIYFNYNPTSTQPNQNSIMVVDDGGYATNLTSIPQRIISLAPSNTQILYAIGVGDKVVGVTDYDHYPYDFSAWIAAGNMTSIGGFSTPNKETIVSLEPDLILATPINDPDDFAAIVVQSPNFFGIVEVYKSERRCRRFKYKNFRSSTTKTPGTGNW